MNQSGVELIKTEDLSSNLDQDFVFPMKVCIVKTNILITIKKRVEIV